MGWTCGFSDASDAITSVLRGMTVHYIDSGWVVASSERGGPAVMAQILLERYDGDVCIKLVELTCGPHGRPPAAAAQAYFDNGGTYEAAGQYGEPILRAVTNATKETS